MLGAAISGISLVLLNADKFLYFRWPLTYLMLSVKRAAYLWLTTTGIAVMLELTRKAECTSKSAHLAASRAFGLSTRFK